MTPEECAKLVPGDTIIHNGEVMRYTSPLDRHLRWIEAEVEL
jgi:hypothetical protein